MEYFCNNLKSRFYLRIYGRNWVYMLDINKEYCINRKFIFNLCRNKVINIYSIGGMIFYASVGDIMKKCYGQLVKFEAKRGAAYKYYNIYGVNGINNTFRLIEK